MHGCAWHDPVGCASSLLTLLTTHETEEGSSSYGKKRLLVLLLVLLLFRSVSFSLCTSREKGLPRPLERPPSPSLLPNRESSGVQVEKCIFYTLELVGLFFLKLKLKLKRLAWGSGRRAGGGGGGWRGFTHSAETGTKGEQVRTRGRRGYQGRCRRTRASAEHGRRSRGRIHASAKQEAA